MQIKISLNLKRRIYTTLISIFPVIFFTWIGLQYFILFYFIVGILIIIEWNKLIVSFYKNPLIKIIIFLFYFILGIELLLKISNYYVIFNLILFNILILFFSIYFYILEIVGFLYASFLFVILSLLRRDQFLGLETIWFIYATVWGTDIGAYFFGNIFKGPKIAPKISASKTYSGAIGGILLGTISGYLITIYFITSTFSYFNILFIFFVTIVAQIGDFCESKIKRYLCIKDSGKILPGHGGIIDRIDSLVPSAIFVFCIKNFII